MSSAVFDRIRDIVVEVLKVDKDKITIQSKIRDDLGADSLDAVTLVMTIEDAFKGSITDEEAQKLQTVGDIVELIEKQMKETAA